MLRGRSRLLLLKQGTVRQLEHTDAGRKSVLTDCDEIGAKNG
jgi:hypothetical protein